MKLPAVKKFKPMKDLGEGMEVAPGLARNVTTSLQRRDLSYQPDPDEIKPKFTKTRNMFKTGY